MPTSPSPLDAVRARIDAVDDALLALLDERAALAAAVVAAKREEAAVSAAAAVVAAKREEAAVSAAAAAEPAFGLRPARETQVIRRLLAQPLKAARPALVVRVWRELMGESLAAQSAQSGRPFRLAVWGGRAAPEIASLARLRFGAAPVMTMADTPEAALAAARTTGTVGLLALEGGSPWWARLLAEPQLRVFAIAPCLAAWGAPRALAVAMAPIEPSGFDQTLWLTDAALPTAAIEAGLGSQGLAGERLAEAAGVRLFSLAGFVQEGDPRLVPGAERPWAGRLSGVIGAAATPLDL